MPNTRTRLTFTLATVLAATFLPVFGSAARQRQSLLQITVPSSGIIVNPGQNLSVSVTSPAGLTFSQLDVIGEQPIGISTIVSSVPAQFTLPIPSNIACGTRTVIAEGTTSSGQNVQSAPITIDVERSDLPSSLSTSAAGLLFEAQGQQSSLVVFADFLDGTMLRVTESSYVSYTSSNNAVATVDAEGNVTAVAPGNAAIAVTYTLGSQSPQISVPVTVQNPVLSTSPSSINFGPQEVGTSSPPQSLILANAATNAVSVLNIATSGDFSETDNCISSSPLAANASCTISISFTPTGTGARTGTVEIANNGNSVPIVVSLSGTGAAAPPPPAITTLTPNSGAGGTSVVIAGTNFGASQGTSTVTFNGETRGQT